MFTSITFQELDLPQKLYEASQSESTGYWQFHLTPKQENGDGVSWYLALIQGRVVFSGTKKLSLETFCQVLLRYISRLRTPGAKEVLQNLIQESSHQEREVMGKILVKMGQKSLLNYQDAVAALQTQILSDFDTYLFDYQGQANFIPDYQLISQSPIAGFDLNSLLLAANQRREQWQALRSQVPSIEVVPRLNVENIESSQLPLELRQKLRDLTQNGKTLGRIAYDTAKDPLEIAKFFAKLAQQNFLTFELPSGAEHQISSSQIFVVDDSPVLLHEFRKLLTQWGYQVHCCANAEVAVKQMLESRPAAAFLDINMPGLSGFDLIKEIRRHSSLSTIPLVLLTAENSLANQWRAKWGNCEFLAKPRTPQEVDKFKGELRHLLQKITQPTARASA